MIGLTDKDQKAEQLAQWFVYGVVRAAGDQTDRVERDVAVIHALYEDGWELIELQREVESFAQSYPDMTRRLESLSEIFVSKTAPSNLIQKDVFYYHDALRDVSPPPRIKRLPDGTFEKTSSPFYLEMKRRFTLHDLMEYWYTKMQITPNPHMIKQDEGKFKYLLKVYDIDEILFAIDEGFGARRSMQRSLLSNAFDLERYVEGGREAIVLKKNAHMLQGINKIIRKEREA